LVQGRLHALSTCIGCFATVAGAGRGLLPLYLPDFELLERVLENALGGRLLPVLHEVVYELARHIILRHRRRHRCRGMQKAQVSADATGPQQGHGSGVPRARHRPPAQPARYL